MMKTKMKCLIPVVAAISMPGCFQANGPRLPSDEHEETPMSRVPHEGEGEGEDEDGGDDGADSGAPGQNGEGEADMPKGRRVRRMTADQFHATLTLATGQPWPLFDEYAEAMGKADFANVTVEGREISVTFDKFIHDAALHSCAAAVDADQSGGGTGTVLRWANASDRDQEEVRRNLDYLMLRFLGQEMGAGDDPRVDPWMNLLLQPSESEDIDDDEMKERWTAVCIGLATHPDFLTY